MSDSLWSVYCSPPGCSVHGILQARVLKWIIISFSRGLPDPRIEPIPLMSPALAGEFFTTATTCEGTHPPPTHTHTKGTYKISNALGSRAKEEVWREFGLDLPAILESGEAGGNCQVTLGTQTLAEVTFGGSFYHVRLLLTSIFWKAHSSLLDSGPSSASIRCPIDTSKGTSQAKQPTWRGKSPTHQQRDCLKNPLSPFDVAFPVRGHTT